MVVPCVDVHALRYSFFDPFHIVMSDGSERCDLQSPGTRAGISMLRRSNSIEDLLKEISKALEPPISMTDTTHSSTPDENV